MSIGNMEAGEYHIRAKRLVDLIDDHDLLGSMWLAWTGDELRKESRPILEACLVACLDHGEEPPSAHVTRVIASAGKPLAESVAGGLLTLGPKHGHAGSAASKWLRESLLSNMTPEVAVKGRSDRGELIPGFGHPVYEKDPRTEHLLVIVRKELVSTPHCDFALRVSEELTKQSHKFIPLNIDGALGAIVADMNLKPDIADAIFLAARTMGLIAHYRDEAAGDRKGYRRG